MLFFVLVALFWLRFQDLGLKAVHHDESINGWFTLQVWNQGWYNYDPSNYHGPLMFYLFALSERLGGWGIVSLRATTVLFSIFWLWYLWRFWTRYQWSSRWFVLVAALSPGFLFFSRSAIHELPFLFFLTLAMGGLIEILHYQQRRGWLALIWGICGAVLLKETWVILAVAMFAAAGLTAWMRPESGVGRVLRQPLRTGSALKLRALVSWHPEAWLHAAFALTLIVLLYSGFGAKPLGILDLVLSYLPWMKTGVGEGGHSKPIWHWFELLWRYEKPLLFLFLGLFSTAAYFHRRLSTVALWIGLSVCLNVLLYSLIPYKTPWCIVAVFGPMIFAYGLMATELRGVHWRNPLQALLAASALVALVFQWNEMQELNFKNPTDHNHEYVYVQTDQRLKYVIEDLYAAAEKNPALYASPIQLGGAEPWPMSWWLSRFSNHQLKPFVDGVVEGASLIVVDRKDEALAREKISADDYHFLVFPIREGREDSIFMVKKTAVGGLNEKSFTAVDGRLDTPPARQDIKEGER